MVKISELSLCKFSFIPLMLQTLVLLNNWIGPWRCFAPTEVPSEPSSIGPRRFQPYQPGDTYLNTRKEEGTGTSQGSMQSMWIHKTGLHQDLQEIREAPQHFYPLLVSSSMWGSNSSTLSSSQVKEWVTGVWRLTLHYHLPSPIQGMSTVNAVHL